MGGLENRGASRLEMPTSIKRVANLNEQIEICEEREMLARMYVNDFPEGLKSCDFLYIKDLLASIRIVQRAVTEPLDSGLEKLTEEAEKCLAGRFIFVELEDPKDPYIHIYIPNKKPIKVSAGAKPSQVILEVDGKRKEAQDLDSPKLEDFLMFGELFEKGECIVLQKKADNLEGRLISHTVEVAALITNTIKKQRASLLSKPNLSTHKQRFRKRRNKWKDN